VLDAMRQSLERKDILPVADTIEVAHQDAAHVNGASAH
jgi:hypothetical protein